MLKVMLQKLLSKKWMSFCQLIGIILLIATAVSFPMYRGVAFDRMLRDEFTVSLSINGEWPAMNRFTMISKKEAGGASISRMEGLMEDIHGILGVTEKETIVYYRLSNSKAYSLMGRKDIGSPSLRLGFMSDLPDHTKILAGEMYSERGITQDGCLEAVISQSCLVSSRLLVGEIIEFEDLKTPEGNPVRVKITGVFEENGEQDFYWQRMPEEMNSDCLVAEEVFRKYFTGERAGDFFITCTYYSLFEYKDLEDAQVESLKTATTWLTEESPYHLIVSAPVYADILDSYTGKRTRIEVTLLLLQVPVLIFLGAFLFMISGQIYDMERNEISVMKSRGAGRGQILRLYLYQSIFLAVLGTALGLLLGKVFACVLGSARSFLEFDYQNMSALLRTHIPLRLETVAYAASSMAVCILIMALPAVRHSKLSIVNLKQQKAVKKHAWWEICFLDVICTAIALYGYYTYSKGQEAVLESALTGEAMDPLRYISSSLFIVGLGLFALRLQMLLLRIVYAAGRRFWGPASYISFMENNKNGRKQHFIMLFLILAVSLGMFHAAVARTILQNAVDNVSYLDGTDYIVREIWYDNSYIRSINNDIPFQYYEPDYDKYARLESVSSYTKVIYDSEAYIQTGGNGRQSIILMGIHSKQFGENTYMPKQLTEKHYYEYLNELAANSDGILVSASFRDVLGYKTGDRIIYYDSKGNQASGTIVDFFSYWPGYAPTVSELNPDGSVTTLPQYMLVAPIGTLTSRWGLVPYEVWMKAKENSQPDEFYRWAREEDVHLLRYTDRQSDMEVTVNDPLLQGTNGILTMGFLITILLCAVGYLIYWILSIRSREMIFGILRANGMYKREIFHILINEQIFCGGFSVLAGIVIGRLTCNMFVPILQTAYAAADQALPMRLITNEQDMIRLYSIIAAVLLLCVLILFGLIRRLNVTKALKLGEE